MNKLIRRYKEWKLRRVKYTDENGVTRWRTFPEYVICHPRFDYGRLHRLLRWIFLKDNSFDDGDHFTNAEIITHYDALSDDQMDVVVEYAKLRGIDISDIFARRLMHTHTLFDDLNLIAADRRLVRLNSVRKYDFSVCHIDFAYGCEYSEPSQDVFCRMAERRAKVCGITLSDLDRRRVWRQDVCVTWEENEVIKKYPAYVRYNNHESYSDCYRDYDKISELYKHYDALTLDQWRDVVAYGREIGVDLSCLIEHISQSNAWFSTSVFSCIHDRLFDINFVPYVISKTDGHFIGIQDFPEKSLYDYFL